MEFRWNMTAENLWIHEFLSNAGISNFEPVYYRPNKVLSCFSFHQIFLLFVMFLFFVSLVCFLLSFLISAFLLFFKGVSYEQALIGFLGHSSMQLDLVQAVWMVYGSRHWLVVFVVIYFFFLALGFNSIWMKIWKMMAKTFVSMNYTKQVQVWFLS